MSHINTIVLTFKASKKLSFNTLIIHHYHDRWTQKLTEVSFFRFLTLDYKAQWIFYRINDKNILTKTIESLWFFFKNKKHKSYGITWHKIYTYCKIFLYFRNNKQKLNDSIKDIRSKKFYLIFWFFHSSISKCKNFSNCTNAHFE